MAIITCTREARCKDCQHLKYYYKGKLKRHYCVERKTNRCLEDSAAYCIDQKLFQWNPTAIPERLNENFKNP